MAFWNHTPTTAKRSRQPVAEAGSRVAELFAAPHLTPAAGWWRDDSTEQLRNYQSWVYAAVNAIAQGVAMQRPFCAVATGQAGHDQMPLAHTHPLVRLLDNPNPWMTPWELWYLTAVYLELTGNSLIKRITRILPRGKARSVGLSPFRWTARACSGMSVLRRK